MSNTHSSEVFLAARQYGWAEKLGHRSVYGDQFVTYTKGVHKVNVQGGREGRVVWCAFYEGDTLVAHLTSRVADKAGCIVSRMRRLA